MVLTFYDKPPHGRLATTFKLEETRPEAKVSFRNKVIYYVDRYGIYQLLNKQ